MSRDRGVLSGRFGRFALVTASVTVLSLTASGCVVVHGEREIVPAATQAEAARALKDFTTAYNKADKAFDQSLDAERVAGALAAIDSAKLKAGSKVSPDGNASHAPLELTDAEFTIPEKAGWPRWFVADADSNKGAEDARWLLVFTRASADDVWAVSYLTILSTDDIPEFEKDEDGNAQPVTADDAALAVAPGKLGKAYVEYMDSADDGDSAGGAFAPGRYTSEWRTERRKNESKPGLARQYIDEPLTGGAYAPVGLRTKDGGALVFFATRHYEKQTAHQGVDIPVSNANVQALLTGDVKSSLTLERVSNQAVLDPARTASDQQVRFLSRVDGLVAAKGE
ncbi:hypothetical protein [Streptomyces poonensis]|uniref:Lipoprotein n=1 Tax=Streptomyces poonensis TaxID=68255 RepID=A0A918PJ77_9ACTN|nr:hypothetical protein [Streptomyces poonensis]GGZ10734.1 putative lipoprotein [Streptomyces poonensis]GLJ91416.1 putative lipoprotein [Streptomyces poonensis]